MIQCFGNNTTRGSNKTIQLLNATTVMQFDSTTSAYTTAINPSGKKMANLESFSLLVYRERGFGWLRHKSTAEHRVWSDSQVQLWCAGTYLLRPQVCSYSGSYRRFKTIPRVPEWVCSWHYARSDVQSSWGVSELVTPSSLQLYFFILSLFSSIRSSLHSLSLFLSMPLLIISQGCLRWEGM